MLPTFAALGEGAGESFSQTSPPKPVTDRGIQEIFGLNCIKRDLKTPQNRNIAWEILPQTPYTMYTSVVSYYIHCTVRHFPPQKYSSRENPDMTKITLILQLFQHTLLWKSR